MLTIPKEMIGALIGPGGKVIQEIQRETGTTIVVEEKNGCGDVNIFGENKEAIVAALDWVKKIVAVPEVGTIYKGKVKSIVAFGAFVEILPNKDGLLHISEIEWRKINTVDEVLKEGQEIEVKLIDVDPKTGKLKLSRKVLLPRPPREEKDGQEKEHDKENDGGHDRGHDRVHDRGHDRGHDRRHDRGHDRDHKS
jgi:polyribonucleotide nucleotidyltransferase